MVSDQTKAANDSTLCSQTQAQHELSTSFALIGCDNRRPLSSVVECEIPAAQVAWKFLKVVRSIRAGVKQLILFTISSHPMSIAIPEQLVNVLSHTIQP